MLSDAARLTIAGLVIGSVAAQILVPFMTSLLFDVSPSDRVTRLGVAGVLGGVALLAGYVPARRAMAVDPLVALRQE